MIKSMVLWYYPYFFAKYNIESDELFTSNPTQDTKYTIQRQSSGDSHIFLISGHMLSPENGDAKKKEQSVNQAIGHIKPIEKSIHSVDPANPILK